MTSTDVPEQDTEGVDIHAVVVVTSEQLGRHVDGSSNNTARHHRLRFTEAQISDFAAIFFVKLRNLGKGSKKISSKENFEENTLYT